VLPLTEQARKVVDEGLLRRLRFGAGFVNVGRGEHVDNRALLAALDEKRLSAAIIDVCQEEPPPPHHPFWGNKRILMTGHNAAVADRRESG
jgi:glyoxylate/hydroxypyruvate reductase A